jgi:hypothetical protein
MEQLIEQRNKFKNEWLEEELPNTYYVLIAYIQKQNCPYIDGEL